jgi:ABC-2 type transport system ATP-binding protein
MIEIENLSKNFGVVQAVRNLSLKIAAGELFCFLGPNGAGKTTSIKMMCGLLRPSAGKIAVGGYDLAREPAKVRQIIGYIPDTPYLYERLTPAEFYEFIGDLYKIPEREVVAGRESAFELFGLGQYADCLIKDLSHGYRQRLIYAATFLHKPQVLFIDEPFIGLDPYTIRLIHDLLKQKAAGGTTIFLTSHILALVEKLAGRIGIIADGRLAAIGTLDELRAQSAVQGPLEDVFLRLTRPDNGADETTKAARTPFGVTDRADI